MISKHVMPLVSLFLAIACLAILSVGCVEESADMGAESPEPPNPPVENQTRAGGEVAPDKKGPARDKEPVTAEKDATTESDPDSSPKDETTWIPPPTTTVKRGQLSCVCGLDSTGWCSLRKVGASEFDTLSNDTGGAYMLPDGPDPSATCRNWCGGDQYDPTTSHIEIRVLFQSIKDEQCAETRVL